MNHKQNIEVAIEFFRSMSEKNKVDAEAEMSYNNGMRAGQSIAWSVAADYLEGILKWEE